MTVPAHDRSAKVHLTRRVALCGMAGTVLLVARSNIAGASSATAEVTMLNKVADGDMVFEPDLARIKPDEKVRFIPTDRTHNAASIKTMMPEGAMPFSGAIDQDITVTFTIPGVYGIMCSPHYSMGMVAVVVVGDPVNVGAAKDLRMSGLAGERMRAILRRI